MRASVVKRIAGSLARVVGKEGGLTLLELLVRHATALEEELQPCWAELSELLPFLARFARGRCILAALVVRESSLQRAVADVLRRKSGGRPRKPLESVGAAAEVWHHFADACVVVPGGAAASVTRARCFLKNRVAFQGDEGVAWVPVAAGPSHLEWCLVWSAAPRLRWKPAAREVRHLRQGGVCVSSPPLAADGFSFVISLLRDEADVLEETGCGKTAQDELLRVFVLVRLLDVRPGERHAVRLNLLPSSEPRRYEFGAGQGAGAEVCVLGARYLWLPLPTDVELTARRVPV